MKQKWPSFSGISEAHESEIKGKGVLVGVLDTGIDADHQEFLDKNPKFRYFPPIPESPTSALLQPRHVRGFDPEGHGTTICGVICGTNLGIAPEVDLHVASIINSESLKSRLNRVIDGLKWLLKEFNNEDNRGKPAIINISIGFYRTNDTLLQFLLDELQKIINENDQRKILIVAAIGNESKKFLYPAAFKEVLGVGCVGLDENQNHFLSELSGSGTPEEGISKPDLVGYGVNIRSCCERDIDGNSHYVQTSGTSIAAAYVTGIAALYLSQNPSLTVDEVKQKIIDNILPIDHLSQDEVGKGLVRFIP